MDLSELPLVLPDQEKIEGFENLLEPTKGFKVGVIDSFYEEESFPDDYNSYNRMPEIRPIHRCKRPTKLSGHGFVCASVLAGKEERADFFGFCQGKIRGIVPDVQLHMYPVGCKKCERDFNMIAKAFKEAAKDKVKVISMSQGLSGIDYSDFHKKWNIQNDVVAQATLTAYKNDILVCVPSGNDGPASESVLYGYPWVVNVGACATGKTLISTVTVGTKVTELPAEYDKLERVIDENDDQEIRILDRIEGISMNVVAVPFYKLSDPEKDFYEHQEGVLSVNHDERTIDWINPKKNHRTIVCTLNVYETPTVSLSREHSQKLKMLHSKMGELWVSISTSKYADDCRGVYIPALSSRGPSRHCPEIIMPDFVAPGCNIIGSHPTSIPNCTVLEKEGDSYKTKDLFSSHKIMTGTSLATPHVAGLFAIILSNRPNWSLAMAKSAATTTAWSFAENNIPGNEFQFGAGRIQVQSALNPGLVYDETYDNFLKYARREIELDMLNLPTFAACFTETHRRCERDIPRILKNIDEDKVSYRGSVEILTNTLDKTAFVDVEPKILCFSAGEELEFVLQVKLCPKPSGYISALLTWENENSSHKVTSPIHLYHKSGYERRLWYRERTAKEKRKAKEAMAAREDVEGKRQRTEEKPTERLVLGGMRK